MLGRRGWGGCNQELDVGKLDCRVDWIFNARNRRNTSCFSDWRTGAACCWSWEHWSFSFPHIYSTFSEMWRRVWWELVQRVLGSYPSVAGIFLEKLPEFIQENVAWGFSLKETQRQKTDQLSSANVSLTSSQTLDRIKLHDTTLESRLKPLRSF